MKKGRDFMKRKRLLSAMLAGIFAVSMLGGCASAVPQGATETTQGSAQETDRTSGTVKLRVWAEESTYDALNKMIDSFKEEYKGQATLISLWNRMRIPIRVTMCLEMCITQLMCLSLQMTRWLLWRPVVHCIRFRMQTK